MEDDGASSGGGGGCLGEEVCISTAKSLIRTNCNEILCTITYSTEYEHTVYAEIFAG